MITEKARYGVEAFGEGARFTQQTNFIADIETFVPAFYKKYGSGLSAWRKPAPKIKQGRDDPEDVSTGALSDEAGIFEA